MTPPAPYSYEIQFDVIGACRSEYDRWLAENSVTWASHDAVTSFHVHLNSERVSPEVRLIFGFQSAEKREAFVNSSVLANAKKALTEVTAGLDAQLWERSGIRLSKDANHELSEPSPCDELSPIPEELL